MGRTSKTCYGNSDYELFSIEKEEQASRLHDYAKYLNDWKEIGIGLFIHKSELFLLDCNAYTTVIYRRDNKEEEFYCGFDGAYVYIDDIEGLKEWSKEEFEEPYIIESFSAPWHSHQSIITLQSSID